ncbi:MAG: secondary thiamine-phosphate synthase enzyme YjbQ [Rhodospirillales bacterium]|jgi:secondary thiamine-phosphate synthase enzyme
MSTVVVHCDSFDVSLRAGPDLADVTPRLGQIVAASGVRQGSAHVTAIGSTASLTTVEYEPGAVEDLKSAIQRLAPADATYAHEMAWHDGNGHSHVQAALLGPSVAVPIRDGRLRLGSWQQVVLINHDIHARRRPVEVTVIGEK